MEHYNLYLFKDKKLGNILRIIKTDSYIDLIKNDPGHIHENLGDIYCKVPCEDLMNKIISLRNEIKDEIKDKSLNLELKLINEDLFNPDSINDNYMYLIKKNDGVLIYIPVTNASYKETQIVELMYSFCAVLFVDNVKAKTGSLVDDIKSDFKKLKQMSKKSKQSIKLK